MPQKLWCRFVDLFPIRVVATLPVDDRQLQSSRFLYGGASVALAESIATV